MTEVVGRVAFFLLVSQFEGSRFLLAQLWFSYVRPCWSRQLMSVRRREVPDQCSSVFFGEKRQVSSKSPALNQMAACCRNVRKCGLVCGVLWEVISGAIENQGRLCGPVLEGNSLRSGRQGMMENPVVKNTVLLR